MKIPYFPFYPDDWMGSLTVQKMTGEERGIYIQLLVLSWGCKECTLPDDLEFLRRMCNVRTKKKVENVLWKTFSKSSRGWSNVRLEVIWRASLNLISKRKEAAKCRWNKKTGNANAMQMQCKSSTYHNHNHNHIKDLTDVIHNPPVHNSDRTSATPAFGEPVADSIRPEKNQPVKPAQKPTRDPKVSTILKSIVQKITTTANPGDGNEAKDDMPKSNPAKPGFKQATIRQPDDLF